MNHMLKRINPTAESKSKQIRNYEINLLECIEKNNIPMEVFSELSNIIKKISILSS